MNYDITTLTQEAVSLLQALITIPSLSREEEKVADYLQQYIELPIQFAIVGESTEMQPAIAEKGLMVLDVNVIPVSEDGAGQKQPLTYRL